MNAPAAHHRLLIPIDATEDWRCGVQDAIRMSRQGVSVEVCLLYIVAPIRCWEVRRFRTEQEIHRHFEERSLVFLEAASRPLREAGIPCTCLFREQAPVLGTLDLAEQFDCSEILMPAPHWLDAVCGSSLSHRLRNARRSIPIRLVRGYN